MKSYSVVPLISSCYSLNSIISLTEPRKAAKVKTANIFNLAQKYQLETLYLVEKRLSGVYAFVTECQKLQINPVVGWKVACCADLEDKTPSSLNGEYNIVIFIKGSGGYELLSKISSLAYSEGFFGVPRVSRDLLEKHWDSDKLSLAIPFYDSFVHNNLLKHQRVAQFDLDALNPTFFVEENGLPFDKILRTNILGFARKFGFEVQRAKSIYYERREDFLAYTVYRCKQNRERAESPNINFFTSDQFCLECWEQQNSKNEKK